MFLRDSILFPVWPDRPFRADWTAGQRGLWAERVVARELWRAGWEIRAHRWKSEDGSDIDLVVANDETLRFVEVKFRDGGDANPWAAVFQADRMARMIDAVREYLVATSQTGVRFRIDGALVQQTEGRVSVEFLEEVIPGERVTGPRRMLSPPGELSPEAP